MPATSALELLWISERQAINPANILWMFRGTHGELEITFSGGKQLTLNERDLSDAGRLLLLPSEEAVRPTDCTLHTNHEVEIIGRQFGASD
jgi:hypothetical protein